MTDGQRPPMPRTKVRLVTVTDDEDGQRVDNFLLAAFKGLPRSRVYRLLRKGEVRVNGGRTDAKRRLVSGDEVRLPPVQLEPSPVQRATTAATGSLLDRVVFEDKRVIVLDKPAGMAVHGGSGVSLGVIETLRQARSDLAEAGLVHRLDRATSGVLVIAKRRSALRALHASFRNGQVEKRYLAGCTGHWTHGRHTVSAPLETRHRRGGERHVVVADSGKAAATRFEPQAFYDAVTLVSAEPVTGRTHQIRVHAAAAGHPLAGDERYGDPEANAVLAKRGLKRLFLHAQSIAFADESGNEQLYCAPLAADLDQFLKNQRRQQ